MDEALTTDSGSEAPAQSACMYLFLTILYYRFQIHFHIPDLLNMHPVVSDSQAIYVLHPTLGLKAAIFALQLFVDGEVLSPWCLHTRKNAFTHAHIYACSHLPARTHFNFWNCHLSLKSTLISETLALFLYCILSFSGMEESCVCW